MSGRGQNVHGTAVVIATTGLIFVGPSGAGKSSIAHACIAEAGRRSLFARLIADDQIFVTVEGGQVVARRPDSISGKMEFRGSGIAAIPSIARARLDYAVLVGNPTTQERLPPEEESFEILPNVLLPLVRISGAASDPLSRLARFVPFSGLSG